MSFFDVINPFKKKEELILPPIDHTPIDMSPHNFEHSAPPDENEHMSFQEPGFRPTGHQPMGREDSQTDSRMGMGLGENMRHGRISGMHDNNNDDEYHEARQPPPNPLQKDLELISSKLDYLKASLDAVNQRLVNLEHLARQDMENKRW